VTWCVYVRLFTQMPGFWNVKNKFFCFVYANPSTMPDTAVSKDREFTFDCNDTVHCVKFSHLEFLTDLLAIGSTIRLTVARCTAKALLYVLLYQTYTQMWSIVIARWRFNIDLKPCPVLSVMLLTLNPNIMLRLLFCRIWNRSGKWGISTLLLLQFSPIHTVL